MARPLTQSDLIFPTQSLNFSSTFHSLKRSALSITNRLASITSDASFVISVSEAYSLPLVANERCGSWYIPLQKKGGSVYFKSTDGHMNEWSFNLRRLNLQLLDLVGGGAGGCVIVDSTRRGKTMPDALSKTIPIWCCVMNRALFPDSGSHQLHTPPNTISASEHAQIEKRIDRFVQDFLEICGPSIPDLRRKIQKPLRPLWITQASTLPESPPSFSDFYPIVLCTASRRVDGNEGSEGGYIQGAADDHEAWAGGLTPQLFWSHADKLLSTNEEDLPSLITTLVEEEQGPDAVPILVKPTSNLYISSSQDVDISPYDIIVSCTPEPLTTSNPAHLKTKKYLHLPLAVGKLGSRDLRLQLSRLAPFFESLQLGDSRILVCDPTGKDLAVGVALAILCTYADENGNIPTTSATKKVDKTFIKQRLSWITTTSPALNPSRETLKSVNAFLMPDPSSASKTPTTDSAPSLSNLVLVDANGTPISPEQPNSLDAHNAPEPTPTPTTPAAHTHTTCCPPHDHTHTSDTTNPPPPSDQTPLLTTLFARLQTGTWTFVRTLSSKLARYPSGTVNGTATFTPSASDPSTLLYLEEGDFATDAGAKFATRMKYVYQLQAPELPVASASASASAPAGAKQLAVYFHDDATARLHSLPLALGAHFVTMGPVSPVADSINAADSDFINAVAQIWGASNTVQHLCGEDLYTASWKFGRGMLAAESGGEENMWWEVRYDVKGPKKDYVSETFYFFEEGV